MCFPSCHSPLKPPLPLVKTGKSNFAIYKYRDLERFPSENVLCTHFVRLGTLRFRRASSPSCNTRISGSPRHGGALPHCLLILAVRNIIPPHSLRIVRYTQTVVVNKKFIIPNQRKMKKITLQIVLALIALGLPFATLTVKSEPQERCQMQCVDVAMVVTEGWPIPFSEKAISYEGSANYTQEDFNKFEINIYLLNVLIFFIFLNGLFNIGNEIYQASAKRK